MDTNSSTASTWATGFWAGLFRLLALVASLALYGQLFLLMGAATVKWLPWLASWHSNPAGLVPEGLSWVWLTSSVSTSAMAWLGLVGLFSTIAGIAVLALVVGCIALVALIGRQSSPI